MFSQTVKKENTYSIIILLLLLKHQGGGGLHRRVNSEQLKLEYLELPGTKYYKVILYILPNQTNIGEFLKIPRKFLSMILSVVLKFKIKEKSLLAL